MSCEAHLGPALRRPLMPAWLLHPGWQSIFLVCFSLTYYQSFLFLDWAKATDKWERYPLAIYVVVQ